MSKTMKRSRAARHQTAPYPSASVSMPESQHPTGTWAAEEHDRFLEAMKLYPKGPWKAIADHVVTRSVRQVQTHAQKYQEKVVRRMRGLRKPKRKGDESDEEIGHRVVLGTYGKLRKRKGDLATQSDVHDAPVSPAQSESAETDAHNDKDSEPESGDESDSSASEVAHFPVISVSSPLTPPAQPHPNIKISFTSLLETSATQSIESKDIAPLPHNELGPGWLYLDDLGDKALSLLDELDGPTGLPSLGESLDFFIEHLSIMT